MFSTFLIVNIFIPGDRTISPHEFVKLEFTPEVPVIYEPTTVTCTANVPDVEAIYLHSNVGHYCTFRPLNNQKGCSNFHSLYDTIVSICLNIIFVF